MGTHSRPSSGLTNSNFFDWNKQAKNIATKYNPEIYFFIVGTNDASVVKSDPENYIQNYTKMLNELTQNFSTKSQPIYFVLAPNMQNSTLNSNLMKINAVIQKFADDNSYETIKSSEVLSPGNKFVKSIKSPH